MRRGDEVGEGWTAVTGEPMVTIDVVASGRVQVDGEVEAGDKVVVVKVDSDVEGGNAR